MSRRWRRRRCSGALRREGRGGLQERLRRRGQSGMREGCAGTEWDVSAMRGVRGDYGLFVTFPSP